MITKSWRGALLALAIAAQAAPTASAQFRTGGAAVGGGGGFRGGNGGGYGNGLAGGFGRTYNTTIIGGYGGFGGYGNYGYSPYYASPAFVGGGYGIGNYGYGIGNYGNYGYGGYGGYGYNSGPFGGIGMSLYDQEMYKQSTYALANSRYEADTAKANESYQRANLLQQQAISTALQNQQQYAALREKYNPKTGAPAPTPAEQAERIRENVLPKVIGPAGTVIWPEIAPANAQRDAVDVLVAAAKQEAGTGGKASVASVARAKEALQTYGQPALRSVRLQSSVLGNRLRDFLNAVDESLDSIAVPKETPKADETKKPG